MAQNQNTTQTDNAATPARMDNLGQVYGPSVEYARQRFAAVRRLLAARGSAMPADWQAGIRLTHALLDRAEERVTAEELTHRTRTWARGIYITQPDKIEDAGHAAILELVLSMATADESRREPQAEAYRQAHRILERAL